MIRVELLVIESEHEAAVGEGYNGPPVSPTVLLVEPEERHHDGPDTR